MKLGRNSPLCKIDKKEIYVEVSNLPTINIDDEIFILTNRYLMFDSCNDGGI